MEKNKGGILKYMSLFSGIGGFELGIQQSKYKDKLICTHYSEIDSYADSIYRRQFPSRVVRGLHTHTHTNGRCYGNQDFQSTRF